MTNYFGTFNKSPTIMSYSSYFNRRYFVGVTQKCVVIIYQPVVIIVEHPDTKKLFKILWIWRFFGFLDKRRVMVKLRVLKRYQQLFQMNNQQGKRAEDIFGVRITQDYIFRARDLGGKWPVSDYYVELDNDDEPLYFIVQVKSSRRGYDGTGNLKISVSKEKVNQLASYQAPTFIAG